MPYHERLKSVGTVLFGKLLGAWLITFQPYYKYRSCVISHVNVVRVGTLAYYSFRWRSIRLLNNLPMDLRSISSCSVLRLKTQHDIFL